MKTQLTLTLLAALMTTGCQSLRNSALTTEIDFTIRAPNVVEGNEDESVWKALFRRKRMHAHWRYNSQKNLSADKIILSFDPMTGMLNSELVNIKTSVDPKVVIETGNGQMKITSAQGEASTEFTKALGGAIGEAGRVFIKP